MTSQNEMKIEKKDHILNTAADVESIFFSQLTKIQEKNGTMSKRKNLQSLHLDLW